MKLDSRLGLKCVRPLVEEIIKTAKLKRDKKLFISIGMSKRKTFVGHADPCIDYPRGRGIENLKKAFKVDTLFGLRLHGYITMTCPHFIWANKISPDEWVRCFYSVLLHELGHIWDAQHNGVDHWTDRKIRNRILHDKRPEEVAAESYQKRRDKQMNLRTRELLIMMSGEILDRRMIKEGGRQDV